MFVAWRQFADATGGNAVLIAKSKDVKPIAKASAAPAPLSFSLPVTLSMINPFDQGSTPSTFRTNAYPTIAIDGIGRVYVAWSERGWGPYGPNPPSNQDVPPGDARVVLMTSKDGVRWTDRVEALPPENITDQGRIELKESLRHHTTYFEDVAEDSYIETTQQFHQTVARTCGNSSQELNIKLHDIAKEVAAKLPVLLNVESSRGPADHFLMTLATD